MTVTSNFLLEFDKTLNQIHWFDYTTTDKFKNDKIHFDSEELLFIIDGVILNKTELLNNSKISEWKDFMLDAYSKNKETFFDQMRGSFWGVVIDKKNGNVLAYSDHIGTKQVFFASNEDAIVISTNSYNLTRYLKTHKSLKPTLNVQGAYFVLDHGYTIEDLTVVSEISRLIPGHYFIRKEKKEEVVQYYRLKKAVKAISDEEAIEEMDKRFKVAVRRTFEKDKEYGYRHLVALSGGLDTRMTCFVAHELGYTEQMNITFSQTNYLDETIAKKIASDLKHEWIFKSLDNGIFLKDLDRATELTGGNINYFGIAHGTSLLDRLDFSQFGSLHSGQFGNTMVGTFGGQKTLNDPVVVEDLIPFPNCWKYQLKMDYQDQEIYKSYNRCMIAMNSGLLPTQTKSESLSPFYDLEFWEYCINIPSVQRENHRLYRMWVNKKYPCAAEYIWEQTGTPLNSKSNIKIRGNYYSLKQLWRIFLRKTIGRFNSVSNVGINSKNHMNPIAYWFATNPDLVQFYENYVKEHIHLLDSNPELKKYVETMSTNGNASDYVKVLTLLSAAKMIHA